MGPPAQVQPSLEEVLVALTRQGLTRGEVYAKRGRSRRLELSTAGEVASFHEERGWAVRAGTGRGGFFAAATGEPDPAATWPEIEAPPVALPEPAAPAPWSEPGDFAAPLVGETEGLRLLASIGRELEAELPGARLLSAVLEDGSSEAELASSRGVRARLRGRVAALRLEAAVPAPGTARAAVHLAAREARRFGAPALARRLADTLTVLGSGAPPAGPQGGAMLLAPPVGARLLAALLPVLVGPEAPALARSLHDRDGRIGSQALTLVDDGRLPGGAFESPLDGEGVPCRAAVLVEAGEFQGPLLAWWQARGGPGARPADAGRTAPLALPGYGAQGSGRLGADPPRAVSSATASGCSRRASWRDLPRPAPTHLYLKPDPKLGVAALLGGVDRGAYLLDTTGAPRLDFATGRFAVPVCGFAVAGGRASAPIAHAWLSGELRALLHGLRATARDLSFLPLDGMIGCPSLLVEGLELTG
jgi:predicted Zn-dependent protease